jgi:tRNA A-37 threonylcarbamoyl transferase component Bud32
VSVETDQLLGTDLAGYRIESVLGRGGMGVVYLATDLRLKRRVALKLVAPEWAADPRFRERFLREAELAASLDHSHVVPVYGAGETDGQLWIAMRYVQGIDLKTLLERDGALEPARAVELCSQVGAALDAAHAHGLVHRDVKPANVLVTQEDSEEHCYLTDFGLARSPSDEQVAAAAHLSGTIDYTAPEQSAREPLDHRADVYSLGCVLYECLAGQPPFKRPRPAATLFAHANDPPPSLNEARPELPEAIDPVIATALAKEPAERYETCGELTAATRQALGIGAPRFSRRTLLFAGTGAALAVAGAAAVPAVIFSRRDATSQGPPPFVPLTEDGVVRIDPTTRLPVAAVATGLDAGPLAAAEDGAWLLDSGSGEIVHVDAADNRVTQRASPERPVSRADMIAAGAGSVWVLTNVYSPDLSGKETLWYHDAEAEALLAYPPDGRYSGLAIGLGRVWATSWTSSSAEYEGFMHAIIPDSGAVDKRAGGPWLTDEVLIVTDESAVWTAQLLDPGAAAQRAVVDDTITRDGHVLDRVDPSTLSIVATYPLDFTIGDLAAGHGALWATQPDTDTIARIDPATGQLTREIRVGRVPEKLTASADALWVTSARDGTVTRVDPATLNVETIEVGGVPTDVAAGEGAVWVAVDAR